MARQARLVVPGVVHHVVARGVNGARIFRHGFDKDRYLRKAAQIADEEEIQVHGYCLLPNHVHFLVTPTFANGLGRFFLRLHTWWAASVNKKEGRTGHLFQCRYFSSPLSECHYWTALRYVELNAVRAKLVKNPEEWPWCSAREHLKLRGNGPLPLRDVITRAKESPADWKQVLSTHDDDGDNRIRKAHRSSRACGPPDFISDLKARFPLAFRPAKANTAQPAN